MKKVLFLALAVCLCICLIGCNKNKLELPPDNSGSDPEIGDIQSLIGSKNADDFEAAESGDYAIIDVAGYGKMVVCLREDIAPITVENFKKLASQGYYDGLIFHRVVKGFIVEGGEQNADGVMSETDMIEGEFKSNGFDNNLSHVRGVLSMSRTNIPDSAESKFFIVCKDATHLDGEYAAFGYIVAGMDVLDKIQSAEVGSGDRPISDVVINSIKLAKLK